MVDRSKEPLLFEQSRAALNLDFGGINTLLLLTSSMLVVLAIDALKQSRSQKTSMLFALAMACGVAFMVSKVFEYKEKFNAGISMLSNDFFMYYFVLTGMHLGHVLVGTSILAYLWLKSRTERNAEANLTTYESGAIYWHMVDLLWICLFPLLYLVR